MPSRRRFLRSLAGSLLVMPIVAEAQRAGKVPRIGVLWAGTPAGAAHLNEAFKQGLREHGHVEGQSFVLEVRYSDGHVERMAELAAELVRNKVDVIVAATDSAIAAAKRQTQSIPIVMVGASDPVGTGFVASLARPAGNVTGSSRMSPALIGKRAELLREAVPQLSRVAVLWNPDVRGAVLEFKELEEPARSLRLRLQSVELSHADELPRAFAAITQARAEAMLVITPNPVAFVHQDKLVSFARQHRLPSMYGSTEYVDSGGLMAYGVVNGELSRRAATYVDKILKGTRPGELPVEQPTRFELVINLRAAKPLGLTMPPSLLMKADRVVQ